MNLNLVLYVVIALVYGEIMYSRGRHDFAVDLIQRVHERMKAEKNDAD